MKLFSTSKQCKTGLFICFVITLLNGCGLLKNTNAHNKALAQFPLLAPESYPLQQQVTQTFTLKPHPPNSDRTHTLLAVWSITDEQLLFSALTPTGQTLISARLAKGRLHAEKSEFLPEALSPRDVISQLQVAHWPMQSILSATQTNEWSLTEENLTRTLYYRNKKIMTVEPLNSHKITLVHHVFGFTVDIQTLKSEAIP